MNVLETGNTSQQNAQLKDRNIAIFIMLLCSFLMFPISSIAKGCSDEKSNIEALQCLQAEIESIKNERIKIPKGAVVAFERITCPSGWLEYKKAYGRFIRDIDKSGKNIDPDGERGLGGKQEDSFMSHSHELPNNNPLASGAGGGPHSPWVTGNGTGSTGEPFGNSGRETRPKNIALLYCIKG